MRFTILKMCYLLKRILRATLVVPMTVLEKLASALFLEGVYDAVHIHTALTGCLILKDPRTFSSDPKSPHNIYTFLSNYFLPLLIRYMVLMSCNQNSAR